MKTSIITSVCAISMLFIGSVSAGVIRTHGAAERDYVPTGKGWGVPDLSPPGQKGAKGGGHGPSKNNGIFYHGGPVMLGTSNIYYIWYGDWSNNSGVSILNNLAMSIGGSPYFNINTTYYDGNNNYVSNSVAEPASTQDSYSRGTALGDADIQGIVTDAINSGSLPKDTNGIYMVLTSKDVQETSGFCTQYCGWHTHSNIVFADGSSMDTKFAFIGDAAQCPSACAEQTASSPNGNIGADAMASVIAHELEEAVTDPDLNAWYDHRGYENADKCAWTFGQTYTSSNGSMANMNLGGMDYLIQQNWVNANGGNCTLAYP